MKKKFSFLNNEKGSVLLIAVVFLLLLTVIGIFATTTSTIEIQISGNDKIQKMVFYAADSGISYVAVHDELYGTSNVTEGEKLTFPDPDNPDAVYPLSNQLNVNGEVSYIEKTQMPEESGYSAGTVFAICYEVESNATGPNNGARSVNAGFYRIGL